MCVCVCAGTYHKQRHVARVRKQRENKTKQNNTTEYCDGWWSNLVRTNACRIGLLLKSLSSPVGGRCGASGLKVKSLSPEGLDPDETHTASSVNAGALQKRECVCACESVCCKCLLVHQEARREKTCTLTRLM